MLAPIRNNLGIRPKYESETYAGTSILKHDSYKGRSTQGIVKYIGPDCTGDVREGDLVFYGPYDGSLWHWKGETVLLIPESQIVAKLENIPYTGINGVFCREKLDREKNQDRLHELYKEWRKDTQENLDGNPVIDFCKFIEDKIDSYGAYFEAPYEYVIEQIAVTFQETEWGKNLKVIQGHEVKPVNPELYKDEKRVCEYCGGSLQLLRNRSTTRVFYKCQSCGHERDRRTFKSLTDAHT